MNGGANQFDLELKIPSASIFEVKKPEVTVTHEGEEVSTNNSLTKVNPDDDMDPDFVHTYVCSERPAEVLRLRLDGAMNIEEAKAKEVQLQVWETNNGERVDVGKNNFTVAELLEENTSDNLLVEKTSDNPSSNHFVIYAKESLYKDNVKNVGNTIYRGEVKIHAELKEAA
jgi:hypothetical protein